MGKIPDRAWYATHWEVLMRSKFETHVKPYLERIQLWVAKGATQKEVAEKLGVSLSTLKDMKGKHPALLTALEAPKGYVDDLVEAALFKRCTGYDYEEVTKWQTIGRNGELLWLEKKTKKHLPPDPSSVQFWLTNRRPQEWKRMPETKAEEKDSDTGVVMLPEVQDE